MTGVWRWLVRASRSGEWWPYKIPPLLGVGYALLLARRSGPEGAVTMVLAIACLCCVGVFAYTVNDASDVHEDERRGKPNAMARLSGPLRLMLWVVLLSAAAGLAIAAQASVAALALLAFECVLPVLYSVRPLRFKERGIWGVMADASMVHVVPTLWIGMMLWRHGEDAWGANIVLGAATLAAAGLGIRGSLLHQAEVHNAGRTPVRTYGSQISADRLRRLVLRRLLPMEWIANGLMVLVLLPVAPVLWPTAAGMIALEWTRRRAGWRIPFLKDAAGREAGFVPLVFNDVQEVMLPLALALQVAIAMPVLTVLLAAHVLAFLPGIRALGPSLTALSRDVRHPDFPFA